MNNDCTDNELCDPQIGVCVCSEGYQLDDTKKFCYSNTGNLGLGSNTSGYDVDELNNVITEQQQQFDSLKKVNINNYFIFIAIFILKMSTFFRYRLKVNHKNHLK